MIKKGSLTRSNIKSIVGAVANDYDGQVAIVPAFRRGISNRVGHHNEGTDDLNWFSTCIWS